MQPNTLLEHILSALKRIIPRRVFSFFQPWYHLTLVFLGALIYRFPAKKLCVIGVTGTKGKSTTTEIINAILEENGHATALSNTIRFKTGEHETRNMYKMSVPGRFFLQRLLRRAVRSGCTHAVLELSSQAVLLHRHRFLSLDALVFTNIAPEHIEAHGSFEKYVAAKLDLANALARSRKKNRCVVTNADDPHGKHFMRINVPHRHAYSLRFARPYAITPQSITITVDGETFSSPLVGVFNAYNILAAIMSAKHFGIHSKTIQRALQRLSTIPGRVEMIDVGQDFAVVVDYAHTKESLEQLYQTFGTKRKICVLGNTGGGRDTWKRPEMARIADRYCSRIILTNEDPYDEDPRKIVETMAKEIRSEKQEVNMDRRAAIRSALHKAARDDIVLITGKGTDPFICGPNNTKQPWSDAEVAREELERLLNKKKHKQEKTHGKQ